MASNYEKRKRWQKDTNQRIGVPSDWDVSKIYIFIYVLHSKIST